MSDQHPPDFPHDAWARLPSLLQAHAKSYDPSSWTPPTDAQQRWTNFAGGSNAALWRFWGCAQHDETLQQLFAVSSGGANRHIEERELFNFFTNGTSSMECACFALHMLGGMAQPNEFPVGRAAVRKISPHTVKADFDRAFPSEPITSHLSSSLASASYLDWRDKRRVLFHRAAPPRTFFVGSAAVPDLWQFGEGDDYETITDDMGREARIKIGTSYEPLSAAFTATRRKWLAEWHTQFWNYTESFCRNHL
jgi:hypothetical protein